MRNKIDLGLSPDALFLNPWVDPGVQLLLEPEFIWRPTQPACIEGFAVSAHGQINHKIRHFLRVTRRQKRFRQAIEYNVLPAMLEQASFRKSHVMATGRLLPCGASGTRLINRYRWENAAQTAATEVALEQYFNTAREAGAGRQVPVYSRVLETDIAFAIPCRNTFNFYHFITESLAQLTVLDGLEFPGDIYFHFPNNSEKQRPFAEAFVEALFPEFAGRVHFERTPKEYDRVLTAFDFQGTQMLMPAEVLAGMGDHAPQGVLNEDGTAGLSAAPILAMNGVSSALLALRARALKAIEGQDFSHLPRRFFVGRDDRQSRSRRMAGEDLLFEHLALFGFEYVVFESLSPLEQIALMANAEMMISPHGAGFTNMLFAGPQACVIELGTLQTAQFRWGDFWPLAHASQCRYINFFADFNTENPLLEPVFGRDGIVPVALSEEAVARIMSFVVTMLGHVPPLASTERLKELAQMVLDVGAGEQALALLEAHADQVAEDGDLCLLLADCHKHLDAPKSELLALDRAVKADPGNWRTLIRIIWCANRCERPQVIRWALSRLQIDFPDRHRAFVSNHDWLRYIV